MPLLLDTLQLPEKLVVLAEPVLIFRIRTLGTAKIREDAQTAEFPQDSDTLSGSACPERVPGMALGIGVLLALVSSTATEG